MSYSIDNYFDYLRSKEQQELESQAPDLDRKDEDARFVSLSEPDMEESYTSPLETLGSDDKKDSDPLQIQTQGAMDYLTGGREANLSKGEQKARAAISGSAYADTNPDMITSDTSIDAGAIAAGLKAASQLLDDSGGQQVIQGKMPSMPRMPSASRAGYNPTPETIQYGVPLEVLTNMQLRQQAEGYLRDLYRQARQSIRQPNVISLI